MRTYLVGPAHSVTKGEFDGDADEFFSRHCTDATADGAVVAMVAGKTVGWLRYYLVSQGPQQRPWLQAAGTWVEPECRSQRVAQALWARAMKHIKPTRVIVTTVSPEGRHLVGSIVRWFPRVTFEVRAGY